MWNLYERKKNIKICGKIKHELQAASYPLYIRVKSLYIWVTTLDLPFTNSTSQVLSSIYELQVRTDK